MAQTFGSSVIMPWDAASADKRVQMVDRATAVTLLIRDLVGCSACNLSAWHPLSQTHRHETLASFGYSDAVLAHVNDEFVRQNPAFAIAHRDDPRSLRWRDYEHDWGLWFPETHTARDYLIPSGFQEGSTMCLRLPDGRYVGAIHMNWSSSAAATDERREITERFRPVLAELCDQLRIPSLLTESLAPEAFALVISSDGAAFDPVGRSAGPHLGEGSALRRLLLERMKLSASLRFLWSDEEGQCHRVTVVPCQRGMILVTEEPMPWPYQLSLREMEVMHLVTTGASNPQIARQLFISPRTVSTHVEHLLSKMGCTSRTQLAARAMAEGMSLAELPSRVGRPRCGARGRA